jgi:MSHA pilin protein MshA
MNRKRQTGFTLIELVVVITILGILAAFAIPRFASLESEARTATTQGLAGSLRSAATLAHGMWLAQDGPPTISMEGFVVAITNGYPVADNIDDTLADFTGHTFSLAGATGTFSSVSAPSPANCSVSYTTAVPSNAPAVVVDVSGC